MTLRICLIKCARWSTGPLDYSDSSVINLDASTTCTVANKLHGFEVGGELTGPIKDVIPLYSPPAPPFATP
jgi:hypothetical protein